jgi:hypothetical protein
MVDVLTEWFFIVANDLTGIVICDFLKVVVIVSFDDSHPVNILFPTSGVIRYRKALDIWFFFQRVLPSGLLHLEQ